MKRGIFLLFFLLIPFVCAQEIDQEVARQIYTSDELLLTQTIQNDIGIDRGSNAKLNWIAATMSFVPQNNYRQQVMEEIIDPFPSFRDSDIVTFKWREPTADRLSFSYKTTVRTRNTYNPVTTKIEFPLQRPIPEELHEFLEPTPLIDINNDIREQALQIASGKDDLFEVSFEVADWITSNIEYDLQTITADASQQASWVLNQRVGVCDELTTLFLAMMRSLGVPARFVSGISYTNSDLFEERWTPHAWAEVYFFEHGWVPFDLTFNEFGYIDASHIQLKTSNDADSATTVYNWESINGKNLRIDINPLDFETEVISTRRPIESFIDTKMTVLRDNIRFGSHSLLEIALENTRNHYVTANFFINAPSDVNFEQSREFPMMLEPFETKVVHIPFSIPTTYDSRSEYTFPIQLSNHFAPVADSQFTARSSFSQYSAEDINLLQHQREQFFASKGLSDVSIRCSNSEQTIVVYTPSTLTCVLESKNSYETVIVCHEDNCQSDSLIANQQKEFVFEQTFATPGESETYITIKADGESKTSVVPLHIVDEPKIHIATIDTPANVEYDNTVHLNIFLEKQSVANPQNVVVKAGRGIPYIWSLGTMAIHQNLSVEFPATALKPGENEITITVQYDDIDGQKVIKEQTTTISLVNASILQKMYLYVLELFR